GYYDTFRNRLMFPVIDVRGSVIGFSGRILGDGEPKYLNSPDTVVFKKSKNLFGLNLAKKSKMGMILLVEGNIDVVSLHQAGIDAAVASLGTSLTPDQARLISRYTENAVICYDSDTAGLKAAQRAIDILEKTGLTVKVLNVPGAKDPDEYIKERGADSFRALLEKSENHVEYRLMAIRQKYDLEVTEDRVSFLNEATEMLSSLPSAIEREIYGAKVAELAGVTPEAVAAEVKKAYRKRVRSERSRFEKESTRPAVTAQPGDRSLRYDNVRSAAAEEGVIRLLLLDPSLVRMVKDLTKADFSSEFLGRAFGEIKRRIEEGGSVSIPILSECLSPPEISQLTGIVQKPEAMGGYEQAMTDYINKMKTEKLKKDFDSAVKRYRETKGYGDK
ncbi:MAG: DNA primase, partial [Oscillospiraceae bacterium]|nr:DNA primase [Oscillospiraceae bacterium]